MAALNHASVDFRYDDELRGPVGLRGVPFRAPLGGMDVFVGLATALAIIGAAVVVAEGGAAAEPTALTAVLVANIATFAVAGMLWRNARPSSGVGSLLLLEGLLVTFSALVGSRNPGVHVVGVLAGWLGTIGFAWLMVSFPRARPSGGAWAVLSLAVVSFAFGELPWLLASAQAPVVHAVGQCAGGCPSNPLYLIHAPGAASTLADVASVLQALSAAGLLAYMILHFMRASRPRRRTLALLYAAALPLVVAYGVASLLAGIAGAHPGHGAQGAFVATRIVAPLGFIGALLYARSYAAQALGYVSTRLIGEPSIAAVEHLVRSVLDDPLARLAFWSPERSDYVDRHGKPVDSDPSAGDTSWWSLRHAGDPILAIVHDKVLDEDPELLEAVGVATTLALETRRLHRDLVDTVDALHASQKRLVSAASEERRRLERDLHDGAQQKLVALRIHLNLSRSRWGETDPALRSELDELDEKLADAIHDLRSLAHGIFPPLLAEEGLPAALREAALRSAVPVAVRTESAGRLQPECETAVYYCCLEALQNVAKHAGEDATATVRLWEDNRSFRFSVVDDGHGFVLDPDGPGVGLTNMADRLGAVGGSLAISSRPGAGTTVEGRIPLAMAR